MSREDSFGFTQLVEDDDFEDVDKSYLDQQLQPHLHKSNNNEHNNGSGSDVFTAEWKQPTFQELQKSDEQFEQAFYSKTSNIPVVESKSSTNNNLDYSEVSCNKHHQSSEPSSPAVGQSVVPVQYSSKDGKVVVLQGQFGTTSDGSRSIDTQGIQELWSEHERPLRQRKIKCLKILSIVSCIAFFPFGALAVYFAFRTETEFNEGIMRGNIDRAQKFAKRTERLIFISLIMFAVVIALVVTAIVRVKNNSSVPPGPIFG